VNENYSRTKPAFRQPVIRKAPAPDVSPVVPDISKLFETGPFFLVVGRNPITGPTSITYGIAEDGPADLAIYDVVGRQVRSIVNGHQQSGPHTAMWDGRDETGEPVARGVYFARLRAGAASVKKTLVLTGQ
jgi:hypothetical protein